MADYEPLRAVEEDPPQNNARTTRVASLDVFRGLCVFLMMLVDYGGSIFPVIAHSPWNGLHLADFVMPFFLFAAGVSLALVYKKAINRVEATWKAVLRAVKLFLLGVLLQGINITEFGERSLETSLTNDIAMTSCFSESFFMGLPLPLIGLWPSGSAFSGCLMVGILLSGGFFHGISSLTYGVDIQTIRWLGILQRISIGYIVVALCEIWLPCQSWSWRRVRFFKSYNWHWCIALTLSAIYLGLSYGLYVPDWQFRVSSSTTSSLTSNNSYVMVKCSVRGDLSPACNSAGMIDRYVLGVNHLYTKPGYRNLKECNMSNNGQIPETSPSWCQAPFDPEGILSSLTAAVTCLIGLQYGHTLADLQDHKGRLNNWSLFSVSFLALGLFLAFIGIPVNKPLYTVSYMLITSASAGITFCALYLLVDVYGYRHLTSVLEWMGVHSLSIFVLIASNLAVIAIQGFYWTDPENNIIRWTVTRIVHR